MPRLYPLTENHLRLSLESGATNVRVGLCGFTTSMQSYARNFPVVEVQGTFYEPPRDATLQKCLGMFEDFCVVTQSVRDGLDVEVKVEPQA